MNNTNDIPQVEPGIPQPNAVSIYGQSSALDDFPVLKAFQQYIDAEQSKAQKRTTTLCIFFAVILSIVIGVFLVLMAGMSQRNNTLNEQLFQLLRDRVQHQQVAPVIQQPVAPATPSQSDVAMKAMTETLSMLQKQMAEQQKQMSDHQLRLIGQIAPVSASGATKDDIPLTEAEIAAQKKAKAESDRLNKLRAQLAAQKAELAKEKERLHQKEMDLQRRKLYPELYQDTPPAATTPADIEDNDVEVKDEPLPVRPVARPKVKPVSSGDPILDALEDDSDDEDLDTMLGVPDVGKMMENKTKGITSGWSLPTE